MRWPRRLLSILAQRTTIIPDYARAVAAELTVLAADPDVPEPTVLRAAVSVTRR